MTSVQAPSCEHCALDINSTEAVTSFEYYVDPVYDPPHSDEGV